MGPGGRARKKLSCQKPEKLKRQNKLFNNFLNFLSQTRERFGVCVCVCLCVTERQRRRYFERDWCELERCVSEIERERGRERERDVLKFSSSWRRLILIKKKQSFAF